jgi:hypothetical protein
MLMNAPEHRQMSVLDVEYYVLGVTAAALLRPWVLPQLLVEQCLVCLHPSPDEYREI